MTGAVLPAIAFMGLSLLDIDSPYLLVALAMAVLGTGFGLLVQNLVVVSRNAVPPPDLAATTAATLSARGIPEVFVRGAPPALVLALLVGLLPRQREPCPRTDGTSGNHDPAGTTA